MQREAESSPVSPVDIQPEISAFLDARLQRVVVRWAMAVSLPLASAMESPSVVGPGGRGLARSCALVAGSSSGPDWRSCWS